MPNALGWGAGIAGNVMTETDFAQSAAEMPLSASRVFYERSKIAATETPGLGTALTDDMIDPGRGSPVTDAIARMTPAGDIVAPLVRDFSANAIPNSWRESDADLRARGQEPLTKEQYDSDPVPGVTWDARMTVARKQSLKDYHDWKDFKGRQIARSDHGIANFLGELAGAATDPVNYIPILGGAMKEAQAVRWGLGKAVATSAADAALNTALAAGATKSYRNSIGDETTWADVASQSAMAALVGGIFGAAGHGVGLLRDRKANSLARVADARAVLNEAVSHIAAGEDVNLSAGAKDILARAGDDLSKIEIEPGRIDLAVGEKPPLAGQELDIFNGADHGGAAPPEHADLLAKGYTAEQIDSMTDAQIRDSRTAMSMMEKDADFKAVSGDFSDPGSWAERQDMMKEIAADIAAKRVILPENPQLRTFQERQGYRNPRLTEAVDDGIAWAKAQGAANDEEAARLLIESSRAEIAEGRMVDGETGVYHQDLIDYLIKGEGPAIDNDLSGLRDPTPTRPASPPRPRLDTTLPPDDFVHDAEFTAAAQSATKPSTIESMAKDYGIDTADMHLDYEIKQLEAEGKLEGTGDKALLERTNAMVEQANAWGEALRAAATCVLGG